MDMVILNLDGGGADVAGTIGGVPGVVGGVEDVASSVSTIEGTAGAGPMISVGISAYCTYCGCSSYGISRYFGPTGAPGCAT